MCVVVQENTEYAVQSKKSIMLCLEASDRASSGELADCNTPVRESTVAIEGHVTVDDCNKQQYVKT